MTLHSVWMQSNHLIWASNQTEKPSLLKSWLFVAIVTSTDQNTIEKLNWSRSRISSVTLIRGKSWSHDCPTRPENHCEPNDSGSTHFLIVRSHDCKKMFQVFQTLTFAWNNSTEAFAMESSASQHSNATVRFFEGDTPVIERARLRVHSTWVSGNYTRLHADFTAVVILSVTVDFVSMFLLRCPGKSYVRGRQVTGRNFFSLGFSGNHAYRNVEAVRNRLHSTRNRLSRPHFNAVTSTHQFRCWTQRPGSQLHHLIIAPSTHHKTARNSHVVTSCERVVLGKGAKVLINWSAQGICPPHRGRWSWWLGGKTGR